MMMTKDELEKVNEMIQGKQYTDDDAANPINRGSFDKPKLTKFTFVATFNYVARAKGY